MNVASDLTFESVDSCAGWDTNTNKGISSTNKGDAVSVVHLSLSP